MESRKYNTPALFYFPLIEDGDADFVTDYTPAAGDAKIFTDKLISTNPTALILGFDSLSELPAQGAQINEQGAGTAEGVVAFTVITSGTVGGGTAAGFFFMRSVAGQAWSNDDVIDIDGGSTGIADADSTTYDLAATAGLIAEIGNGLFAAALSPTEMTCAQGQIHIVDSATKAIEDQAIQFHTYSGAGLHAFDLDTATQSVSLAAGAVNDASLAGGLEIVFETDFGTNYNTTRNAWVTNGTDFIGTGWNINKTGYALTTADWNVGKSGYSLTTADWNTGKTGYTLAATTGLGAQTANITGNLSGTVGSVTGAVGSVAGNVDGNVSGSVASNLELGPAEVNAEVLNVMNVDTFGEPGQGAPGVNISIFAKINFLYKAWRNLSEMNATTYKLYNDAGAVVDQKAPVSDDTTDASKGEVVSGP